MPEALYERFGMLETALNAEHFERAEEVRCALLALVSGTTFFMVGAPGLAKSLLIRRLALRISDVEFFDLDLDKFTTPDDLFGPRSLQAMKQDQWVRATNGTLVTAHFAMLDEFFEGNSALLKALLRTLNERTFRQGTEVIPMRLTTVFAASNQVPVDDRLAALYDRLLIRRKINRVTGTNEFIEMLLATREDRPEPLLTWADVARAQADAGQVPVARRALAAIGDIRRKLQKEGITPSDRRFVESMKVVRAAAWLDGAEETDADHLGCLADILWDREEQRPTVVKVIDTVQEPLVTEAERLLREIRDIRPRVRSGLQGHEKETLGVHLHERIQRAKRDLEALKGRPAHNRRHDAVLARASRELQQTSALVLRELYDVDVSPVVNDG